MATRMQQRRGLAAQWTAANPVLAAGEIGFETDTGKFKMGNGTSTWSQLVYFANASELTAAIDSVVGMAPETLDTLAEIAAALGDNEDFLSALATSADLDAAVLGASSALTQVEDQAAAALEVVRDYVVGRINDHEAETTSVHGIADTSLLATTGNVATAKSQAITEAGEAADTKISDAVAALTKSSVGLSNVDNTADANKPVSEAQASAISTAKTEAITAAGQAADTKISDHNSDSTNVHGITNTADLATKAYADDARDIAYNLAAQGIEDLSNTVNSNFNELNGSIGQIVPQLELKAPIDSPTFTGTVAGVSKAHVGLENVDNTSDANKPVSTATQTALDAKANLSGAIFTGAVNGTSLTLSGNLTVNGTTTTVSSQNLEVTDPLIYIGTGNSANSKDLGLVGHFNDGTYQHTGLTRDASDGKWKLFSGVTTEPSDTIDFTTWTKDTLVLGALEATTVTPSSGIVFSDGTQTKVGVPSITTFATAISSSATLASGEQDKFVPLTGAVQITLPATGYSTGQSIDFYQASGTGASFASTNSVVGTPGLKFRTTNSVVTAMKTASGWLVFGDLSA